mgnify:CR=1 FL=1
MPGSTGAWTFDTVPGLANRRAAKSASSIAVSFPPETMTGLPERKLVYTGNPIRAEVIKGKAERARKRYHLSKSFPTVLILGGSQGSVALNNLIWEALPKLLPDAQIVHQVGQRNAGEVQRAVKDLPPHLSSRYHPQGYFGDELYDLYAATDLIVSRAGANTLAERAAVGKPKGRRTWLPGNRRSERRGKYSPRSL